MAKRKRLTPAQSQPNTSPAPAPESKSMFPLGVARHAPPIAQVAGDASSVAALQQLATELRSARENGRLVQALPLAVVDAGYLVRDRMIADEDELSVLMKSLQARGQQTPIEVVEISAGRYGLISGWRRLTAIRRLHEAEGEGARFATVQALLRRPETASDAYLAMVEENEIRVGLSYYERARIAARAAEQGVFADQAAALQGLFGSASRAKRSKIGSFLRLYAELDDHLRFPSAISERLGLALVRALAAEPGFAVRLTDRLRKTVPETATDEVAALERALKGTNGKQSLTVARETAAPHNEAPALPAMTEVVPGIYVEAGQERLALSGAGVTDALHARLVAWLQSDEARG